MGGNHNVGNNESNNDLGRRSKWGGQRVCPTTLFFWPNLLTPCLSTTPPIMTMTKTTNNSHVYQMTTQQNHALAMRTMSAQGEQMKWRGKPQPSHDLIPTPTPTNNPTAGQSTNEVHNTHQPQRQRWRVGRTVERSPIKPTDMESSLTTKWGRARALPCCFNYLCSRYHVVDTYSGRASPFLRKLYMFCIYCNHMDSSYMQKPRQVDQFSYCTCVYAKQPLLVRAPWANHFF